MISSFSNGFFDELLKLSSGVLVEAPPESESPPEEPEPEPDPETESAANLASSEGRRHLSDLLGTTEGRQEIRNRLESLRARANAAIDERKALTRGLLRARRSSYGPSPTPRRDLTDLLYGGEPFWTARFAR